MIILFLFLFILIPVVLAAVHRTALIHVSLLIGMLPFTLGREGMTNSVLGRMDITAVRLLGLWIAAFLIILGNFDRVSKYIHLYRFHLLFLLFCSLSLIWSPSLAYGTRMLAKLSSPFLFILIIMAMITSLRQLERMEQLIIAGGIGALFLAVLNRTFHLDNSTTLTVPGTTSAYFSAYTVVVGALVLANVKYQGPVRNVFLLALFTAATLAAFTRITIVSMFVAFSVILFMAGKGVFRFFLPLAGLVGLPVLFLFNESFKKRMFYGENKIGLASVMRDPSILLSHLDGSGRFTAWHDVLTHFFKPNPFEGSGLGTTQNYYYSNSITGLGAVHSEYVRLLADVGLVGLSLFIVAMLFYLVRLIRIYKSHSGAIGRKFALAATGGLLTYLIFMATDNGFDYVNGFGLYVFGMIAMSDKARELEQAGMAELASRKDHLIEGKELGTPLNIRDGNSPRRYPIIDGKRLKNVIS